MMKSSSCFVPGIRGTLASASKTSNRKGQAMSIDRYNHNTCKYTFLNAKNCASTAKRQDFTREFCMALWYHERPECADNDMIDTVVSNLTNCAPIFADEHDFELIANCMRNAYYDGVDQGFSDGENQWRSMGYTEGYENGYAEGWEEARDGE